MGGPHLCDNPDCGFCTPIRLRERLARGERARKKLANLIEHLEADPDGVTDNDLMLLDLQDLLSILQGTEATDDANVREHSEGLDVP